MNPNKVGLFVMCCYQFSGRVPDKTPRIGGIGSRYLTGLEGPQREGDRGQADASSSLSSIALSALTVLSDFSSVAARTIEAMASTAPIAQARR
jgi:hypothetical protein